MVMRALRRWALGHYEPAAPLGARRTEAEIVDVGRTPIAPVDAIPADRRRLIESVQVRQHAIMNRAQHAVGLREIERAERDREAHS